MARKASACYVTPPEALSFRDSWTRCLRAAANASPVKMLTLSCNRRTKWWHSSHKCRNEVDVVTPTLHYKNLRLTWLMASSLVTTLFYRGIWGLPSSSKNFVDRLSCWSHLCTWIVRPVPLRVNETNHGDLKLCFRNRSWYNILMQSNTLKQRLISEQGPHQA